MPDGEIGKLGCGCLSLVVLVWAGLPLARLGLGYLGHALDNAKNSYDIHVENCRQEQRAALERERVEKEAETARAIQSAKAMAAAKREAVKTDKLRTFALQDAPGIWRAYQQLEAAIAVQNARIKELATTLREFDKDPESDADYKAICAARDEMVGSLIGIRRKLEEAYLASCRFKATPSHKEYADLMRKALEDGTRAADAATRKFEQMKVEK